MTLRCWLFGHNWGPQRPIYDNEAVTDTASITVCTRSGCPAAAKLGDHEKGVSLWIETKAWEPTDDEVTDS